MDYKTIRGRTDLIPYQTPTNYPRTRHGKPANDDLPRPSLSDRIAGWLIVATWLLLVFVVSIMFGHLVADALDFEAVRAGR